MAACSFSSSRAISSIFFRFSLQLRSLKENVVSREGEEKGDREGEVKDDKETERPRKEKKKEGLKERCMYENCSKKATHFSSSVSFDRFCAVVASLSFLPLEVEVRLELFVAEVVVLVLVAVVFED